VKVRLVDIPPEGLQATFTDTAARPQDLGEQVESIGTPPRASVWLQRRGEAVAARGSYAAEVTLSCSRCLAPYCLGLAGEVEWAFRPQPEDQPEDLRLTGDDLEVIFYRDGELDLAQALRDEVNLALPMAPLCRGDCPGLCPVCGRALQPGQACCRQKTMDPRWAELAKLKT